MRFSLLLSPLLLCGCGMLQPLDVAQFVPGETLSQQELEGRLQAAGYGDDLYRRYYCEDRDSDGCGGDCSRCTLKLFGFADNTITLVSAGGPYTVTEVVLDRNPRYAYLARRRQFANPYQRARQISDAQIDDAILASRVIEGMTLEDAAAAHPNSRFTQTYWCNNKKFLDCPGGCQCLDVVYEENYTGVQGSTLFMGHHASTDGGEASDRVIVKIYPAIHKFPYLIFP